MTTKIEEMGILRPNAGLNQIVEIGETGCCDGVPTCQDSLVVANTAAVTGGVLTKPDGSTVAIAFASVTGAANVKAAFEAALAMYEINPTISAEAASPTTYTLAHIGQATLTSVTVAGTPTATTRICTQKTICDYCATVSNTPIDVQYGGNTVALTNAPYATAGALKTDLDAALTTLTVPYTATTVEVDTIAGGYLVTITADGGLTLQMGNKVLAQKNCAVIFQ